LEKSQARIKCVYGEDDNRVICVSKTNITYEQFLKKAEEEFGFPVVIYRYIDPCEGDPITVKNESAIDLAHILSIPISKPQTYDLKVFVKDAPKSNPIPSVTSQNKFVTFASFFFQISFVFNHTNTRPHTHIQKKHKYMNI
jgi:hypothetical protein